MKYHFTLSAPNGNFHALLKNVEIKDSCIHGIVIGRFIGFDENGDPKFVEVPPREYHAGGNAWVLAEYNNDELCALHKAFEAIE